MPSWNPWEPVHYPSLLPLKGARTPLCRVACACLGASQELLLTGVLLKTHKHKLLRHHTAITHCIINWPQLQADLVPQYCVWKPGTRTVEAVSCKITLFVAVIEPGPASGTQQLLLRKSAPHCPLPPLSSGPHPGLPTRSPSHAKNTQLTKPALGCSHSTLKIQRLTILPSAFCKQKENSVLLLFISCLFTACKHKFFSDEELGGRDYAFSGSMLHKAQHPTWSFLHRLRFFSFFQLSHLVLWLSCPPTCRAWCNATPVPRWKRQFAGKARCVPGVFWSD